MVGLSHWARELPAPQANTSAHPGPGLRAEAGGFCPHGSPLRTRELETFGQEGVDLRAGAGEFRSRRPRPPIEEPDLTRSRSRTPPLEEVRTSTRAPQNLLAKACAPACGEFSTCTRGGADLRGRRSGPAIE